ncbi:MAG TPA: hypothetical protein VIK28_07815 [Sedimentisphaerales bacterium]
MKVQIAFGAWPPVAVAQLWIVRRLAPQDDMLCDICQKREATAHETHCTNIAGDIPKQSHLCDECLKASNPTQARELTTAFEAGCRFCGGKPYIGGSAGLSGIHKMRFMCRPCAEEYHRFLGQKLPGFGSDTITTEQIAKIRTYDMSAVLMEVDEHMKKWVAERDSL